MTPSYLNFDKAAYPWKPGIDYRARPKRYRVGKGEQGVLICEPYKSEIAPPLAVQNAGYRKTQRESDLQNVYRLFRRRRLRRR